jgi:hypothetical protein
MLQVSNGMIGVSRLSICSLQTSLSSMRLNDCRSAALSSNICDRHRPAAVLSIFGLVVSDGLFGAIHIFLVSPQTLDKAVVPNGSFVAT